MTHASALLLPGHVVVSTEPLMYILHSSDDGDRCAACFKLSDELKHCSACQHFSYCSKSCQVSDWRKHHKHGECTAYKKAKESARHPLLTNHHVQTVCRLYLTLKGRPELLDKEFALPDGAGVRRFSDLMTHSEDFLESEKQTCMMFGSYRCLADLIPDMDVNLFFDCFTKMVINSFSIASYELRGTALCIEASIYNHSCKPNAISSWNGKNLEIRVVKEVPAGSEIFVRYIDSAKTLIERQKELLESYFFTCQCEACEAGDSEQFLKDRNMFVNLSKEYTAIGKQSIHPELKSEKLFQTMIKTLPILTRMYGEYSIVKTRTMLQAVELGKGVTFKRKIHREQLREIAQSVEHHVLVTCGQQHEMYNRCMQILSQQVRHK